MKKPFILKVDTTLGDGLNQMRLPTQSAQPMVIDWGDGTIETVTQTAAPASTNWVTHSYAASGIYDISVSSKLERIAFSALGDCLKAIQVLAWGDCIWGINGFIRAFQGCSNCSFVNEPLKGITSQANGSNFFLFAFTGTTITTALDRLTENLTELQNVASMYTFTQIANVSANIFINNPKLNRLDRVFRVAKLVNFPANVFDHVEGTNYDQAFDSNNLNQQSVDNILISVNTARLAGIQITSPSNIRRLGISGGTNATPSQAGKDAADGLRGAGWTVTLNGY